MEEGSILLELFGDDPFIKIVDTLMDHPSLKYTKKDLAEVNDMSRSTLYRGVWDRLEKFNIVEETRKIANTQLFKLNKDSRVVKALYRLEIEVREGRKAKIKA